MKLIFFLLSIPFLNTDHLWRWLSESVFRTDQLCSFQSLTEISIFFPLDMCSSKFSPSIMGSVDAAKVKQVSYLSAQRRKV